MWIKKTRRAQKLFESKIESQQSWLVQSDPFMTDVYWLLNYLQCAIHNKNDTACSIIARADRAYVPYVFNIYFQDCTNTIRAIISLFFTEQFHLLWMNRIDTYVCIEQIKKKYQCICIADTSPCLIVHRLIVWWCDREFHVNTSDITLIHLIPLNKHSLLQTCKVFR